jgi:hypothetical protein
MERSFCLRVARHVRECAAGIKNRIKTEKMGGAVASAPPTLIPPGGENAKNRTKPAGGSSLSHATKSSVRHKSDEIALIDNDLGLPEDGPEHQAHSDGGHGQRDPKLGFGRRLI